MCACDQDFTCARCADTPQDWRYFDDEPAGEHEPETVREPFGVRLERWV